MPNTSYFAVITDQHIVEPGRTLYGLNTRASTEALVEHLRHETVPLKGIISLGDLADTALESERGNAVGSREAYAHARSLLSELCMPFYALPGNHDAPSLLNEYFPSAWHVHENGVYSSTVHGLTFIGIDLRTGAEPTGLATPESIQTLDTVLHASTRAIILSHYPLFDLDNRRIDTELSTINRGEVQAVLQLHGSKIAACLHGHLHLWIAGNQNGILTYGVPSSSFTFILEPQGITRETVGEHPCGYLLLGIDDAGSIIVRPRFLPSARRF
ncbi:MAG: hypothetical protein RL518_2543 [Pseudomonadota bacterium]|jgi:3',5'-cyclic AMP phosphodiesterase CpdA